jgi:uncharacterized SAM-binding protein YcdF (DUF218 family)
MFFIASKIFWFFASPLHLGLFLSAFGLFRLARAKRSGLSWLGGGLGLIGAMTFLPLGAALLRPLENLYPVQSLDMPAPDGIIVLGGAMDERIGAARGQVQLNEAGERMTAGVALARAFPKAKLVFSGGSGALFLHGPPEADVARKLWRDLGAPETMLFEDKSRNTWENAVFTRDLVHPAAGERWLLVTSAWHMPRAMGVFRAAGMNPIAFPVDFRTYGTDEDWRPPGDGALAVRNTEAAVREWIGLIAYRLTGKLDALPPAP